MFVPVAVRLPFLAMVLDLPPETAPPVRAVLSWTVCKSDPVWATLVLIDRDASP